MKATFVLTVICALMATAPLAIAQGPAREGYDETSILQSIEPGPSITDDSNQSGGGDANETLPFTGLDVGILALMGAALVGTGLVVRRSVRSSA